MVSAPVAVVVMGLIAGGLAGGAAAQTATAEPPGISILGGDRVRLRFVVRMDDGSWVPAGLTYRLQGGDGIDSAGAIVLAGAIEVPVSLSGFLPPGARSVVRPPTTVGVIPGTSWFFLRPPYGFEVRSATFNGIDLLRQPIEVTAADDGRAIDIVLTRAGSGTPVTATVAGTVGDHPALDLALIDMTAPRRRIAALAKTDGAGRFLVEGVSPGVYDLEIPPLRTVLTRIVVRPGDVRVGVPVALETRVFGGVVLVYSSGVHLPPRGPLTLVAERDDTQTRIVIADGSGFWGALPPGAYRLALEGVPGHLRLTRFAAGEVNLAERPFVVPSAGAADPIRIELVHEPAN